jgi:hypothetical protein
LRCIDTPHARPHRRAISERVDLRLKIHLTRALRQDAYNLPSKRTCAAPGSITLTPAYQAQAKIDAPRQLQIAGMRLAFVLNAALGS